MRGRHRGTSQPSGRATAGMPGGRAKSQPQGRSSANGLVKGRMASRSRSKSSASSCRPHLARIIVSCAKVPEALAANARSRSPSCQYVWFRRQVRAMPRILGRYSAANPKHLLVLREQQQDRSESKIAACQSRSAPASALTRSSRRSAPAAWERFTGRGTLVYSGRSP